MKQIEHGHFQLPHLVYLHSQTMINIIFLHFIIALSTFFSASQIKRGTHLIVMVMGNGDGFVTDMLSNLFSFTVL